MPKSQRSWMNASELLKHHPQIARLLRSGRPQLWAPRRRTVAVGAAIGTAISVLPIPAQALLAAFAAIQFNAHLPTAVVLTFIGNPFTMLPILGLAWMLGALCLGQPLAWPAFGLPSGGGEWLGLFQEAGMPLLLGVPLLALISGSLAFGIVLAGWKGMVLYRWRKRRAEGS
ncbi:DUF2062 domain-containing protein [Noviherbaspirillum sp. CPCC 100848]|uniref:DUF2062 domain-containing protein n=1 Tax=Noviherbaspirillum album TaxID=3080276 RepID=A0ABU6J3G2_9BURK|nr:DUF2062 domain-containing protein [Noviherbaspirillum sp. CPCC 100848]MEC4717749.1 DUF2062 domain-containing protein [Noviherbaspirillum sp. CPCC 100848]